MAPKTHTLKLDIPFFVKYLNREGIFTNEIGRIACGFVSSYHFTRYTPRAFVSCRDLMGGVARSHLDRIALHYKGVYSFQQTADALKKEVGLTVFEREILQILLEKNSVRLCETLNEYLKSFFADYANPSAFHYHLALYTVPCPPLSSETISTNQPKGKTKK